MPKSKDTWIAQQLEELDPIRTFKGELLGGSSRASFGGDSAKAVEVGNGVTLHAQIDLSQANYDK